MIEIAPSTIVSIIYFSLYVILLIAVAYYVKTQNTHEKIVSKEYLYDVWSQRKIYVAVLVHFYDTATDIGVLINWYQLMHHELNGDNYESVDMIAFFWTGVSIMIFYRICLLIGTCSVQCDDGEFRWYDYIFAVLDLYILKGVYESIIDAQDKINDRQKQMETQIEMQSKNTTDQQEMEKGTNTTNTTTKEKNVEIELSTTQMLVQIGESVAESMAQV